jgi:hypothetical protein
MTLSKRVLVAALLLVVGLPGFFAPHSVRAQEAMRAEGGPSVSALMEGHERAQRNHLWRVAAWGGANLAAGAALALASSRRRQPARFGFGLQSGIWGAVNVGSAGVGVWGGPGTGVSELGPALDAVRGYHDILLLNMGLNVAYAGVGAAMLVAGSRDVCSAAAWRGHGAALIVQGAGLLLLDGVALLSARGRLLQLLDVAVDATLSVGPTGAYVLLRF